MPSLLSDLLISFLIYLIIFTPFASACQHFVIKVSKPEYATPDYVASYADLCEEHGMRYLYTFMEYYMLFEDVNGVHKKGRRSQFIDEFKRFDAAMEFIEQEYLPARVNRAQGRVLINDPLYPDQWHLDNRDNEPRFLLEPSNESPPSLLFYLDQKVDGRGVSVAVVDDGVETAHKDIATSYEATCSFDFYEGTSNPNPKLRDEVHGTRCAGEIFAGMDNKICGIGYAPKASLCAIRLLGGDLVTDAMEAAALSSNTELIDIFTNSWGPADTGSAMDGPGPLTRRALEFGATKGRKEKGSIYFFASGNGGQNGDDCNYDGYANSIYTLAIGAIARDGSIPYYMERCAALTGVTYSSDANSGIVTIDVGTNRCTKKHGGTSAAAPLAAGMTALILQVNPKLSRRDVQAILIQSAEPINLEKENWISNAAGFKYHYFYGFGLIKLEKALYHASNRDTYLPAAYESHCAPMVLAISELHKREKILMVYSFSSPTIETCEQVVIGCKGLSYISSQASITALSPSGTRIQIVSPRRSDQVFKSLNGWNFTTTAYWGEKPEGNWVFFISNVEAEEFNLCVFG